LRLDHISHEYDRPDDIQEIWEGVCPLICTIAR
jgi:hypothetical protein